MLKMNIELLDALTSLSEQINAIAYSLPNLKDEHREVFFGELICKSDQMSSQLKSATAVSKCGCYDLKSSTFSPRSPVSADNTSAKTKPEATKYNFTPLNSFAARLRLAIAHSGMTQAALAWGIGVSQSTISALVTGKSKEAGIVRARAIAETLEVNAQWLLYGEGDMCSKQSESFESQAARIKFSGHNS